jgi:hypothetical protein
VQHSSTFETGDEILHFGIIQEKLQTEGQAMDDEVQSAGETRKSYACFSAHRVPETWDPAGFPAPAGLPPTFFFFFCVVLRFELRASRLQVLYHLSHPTIPFKC